MVLVLCGWTRVFHVFLFFSCLYIFSLFFFVSSLSHTLYSCHGVGIYKGFKGCQGPCVGKIIIVDNQTFILAVDLDHVNLPLSTLHLHVLACCSGRDFHLSCQGFSDVKTNKRWLTYKAQCQRDTRDGEGMREKRGLKGGINAGFLLLTLGRH